MIRRKILTSIVWRNTVAASRLSIVWRNTVAASRLSIVWRNTVAASRLKKTVSRKDCLQDRD